MHALIKNWISISQQSNLKYHNKENLMAHQLELITLINIPPQVFLNSLISTECLVQLQDQQKNKSSTLMNSRHNQKIEVNY